MSAFTANTSICTKKPSCFHVLPEDMKKLYELYNRDGFNKSYYTVRNGRDMMALKNEKEQENKKKQRRNEQLFMRSREIISRLRQKSRFPAF